MGAACDRSPVPIYSRRKMMYDEKKQEAKRFSIQDPGSRKMTIEKVTIADAEALLDVYAPYVRDTAISFEYEVPSVEEFRDRIRMISGSYPYLKAVVDGRIAGYAYAGSFKERKAYDWSVETTIYIRKDCRRSGIGSALYAQLELSLKNMGILNMNACIASPASPSRYLNDDSCRFHAHMGFKPVGRFHNSGYKFNEWFDMIWMEKMIGQHNKKQNAVTLGEWDL